MDNTEELTLGDTTYTLRTRLGWREQQRIDQAALRMYADGEAVAQADGLDGIQRVEIQPDIERQTLLRLTLRLVNINRRDIDAINPAHVPFLIERIEELEAETKAEIDSLREQLNPTKRAMKKAKS